METGKENKFVKKALSWTGVLQMSQQQWMILLLLGVLLVLLSIPVGGKKETAKKEASDTGSFLQSFNSTNAAEETDRDEKSVLEYKMERLLSKVEGVGETQVLLITQDDGEADYFNKGSQKVTGVLISAKGAGNSVVIQNIKEAVMALFQIDAHRIKVMKMK